MKDLAVKLLTTAPLIHRAATPGGFLKRAKYVARGLAFARVTSEWFDFLQTPALAYIVENNPNLYHKLQRPYLNRNLKTAKRLEALKQHYRFILAKFSKPLIEHIYSPSGKLLLELPLKETGILELRLLCGKMQKEGDLTLCLNLKEPERRVATLSFSVWKWDGPHKEIYIGGLQGDKATDERTVVSITRSLYGLRPKALLFFIVQQLASLWRIHHVCAVSDDLHIYRHFQARRNVAASYDQFWGECGGVLASDGIFELPAVFFPREIATLKVNKRQMYRRRYAMLQDLSGQLLANLSGVREQVMEATAELAA
jgi:hypothetical protein